MHLIERIHNEMTTDDDNLARQSERLTDAYEFADPAGKALLNTAFICLCGWSLETLLKRQAEAGDDDDPNGWEEG
jgi:hypothetical protein